MCTTYIYKIGLTLNNQEWFIWHQTKPNQTIEQKNLNGTKFILSIDILYVKRMNMIFW